MKKAEIKKILEMEDWILNGKHSIWFKTEGIKRIEKAKEEAKKQGFNSFKTYEPIRELNSDKCKNIAKSIRNLK
tara:strand:- start:1485 stop:1706 length:222 start_codon:yes stop_codon:yes gene_type:complete